MASKGVMAVELAHDSIAGVFHFSIDENVSGEQSHFSTHVHPIYDLSSMVILWLPWAEEKGRFMLQQYPQFNDKNSAKLDKTWITWCDYNWNLQKTNSTTDSRKEHLGDLNLSKGECVLVSNSCVSLHNTYWSSYSLKYQLNINTAQQLNRPDSNCEISLIHLSMLQ